MISEAQKRYVLKHPERVKKAIKKWNDAHKDNLNEASKSYYHRNKDNPEFKAKNRLSAACFMRVQEFLMGLQSGDC